MLVFAILVTDSITAGWPSVAASWRGTSRPRRTVATASSGTRAASLPGTRRLNFATCSGSGVVPATRTSHSPSRASTLPANTSRNHRRRLSLNAAAVSPRDANAPGSNSTSSSGSWKPSASTLSTPVSCSRSSFTLRAALRRVSSSAWPVRTTIAVGKPFEVVISRMLGSITSAGSSVLALFWISRRRSLMRLSKVRSLISRKRTRMLLTPSREVLTTKRVSCTLRMASSSGLVTRSSMSAAEAPGRAVEMFTQLKLISGSCSRGMLLYARMPMTITTTKAMFASGWFSISDRSRRMRCVSLLAVGAGVGRHSRLCLDRLATRHHGVAIFQRLLAIGHHGQVGGQIDHG